VALLAVPSWKHHVNGLGKVAVEEVSDGGSSVIAGRACDCRTPAVWQEGIQRVKLRCFEAFGCGEREEDPNRTGFGRAGVDFVVVRRDLTGRVAFGLFFTMPPLSKLTCSG